MNATLHLTVTLNSVFFNVGLSTDRGTIQERSNIHTLGSRQRRFVRHLLHSDRALYVFYEPRPDVDVLVLIISFNQSINQS